MITNNIQKSTGEIEYHPLQPFIFPDTRLLFLGSFPPQRKRWCIDFFYPNFINDHWRIQGLVFYNDKDYFVDNQHKRFKLDLIISHCRKYGIGFYDTATAVRRLADNASDKFLEVVHPTDILSLIRCSSQLAAIITTGAKATETVCSTLNISTIPAVGETVPVPQTYGLSLGRLPSSSRAYPMNILKKAEAYKTMFQRFISL